MNLHDDRTYMSAEDNLFISRGYAAEDLHSIRMQFRYTGKQLEAYAKAKEARSIPVDDMEKRAAERSNYIHEVLESIASKFVCYQYGDDKQLKFDSTDWDLFFWCNSFDGNLQSLCGQHDYGYVTLTFNKKHTPEQRHEICEAFCNFLASNFSDRENLQVAVQYTTRYFEDKIKAATDPLLQKLNGKKCSHGGMDGKIAVNDNGVFFAKKYAKNKGYRLSPTEIMQFCWKLDMIKE